MNEKRTERRGIQQKAEEGYLRWLNSEPIVLNKLKAVAYEPRQTRRLVLPFPDGASDIDFEEVDLMSIDTFAAGCIDTFVKNRGRLDEERIKILRGCAQDLDAVLHELSGEINGYFAELGEISGVVLKYLKR